MFRNQQSSVLSAQLTSGISTLSQTIRSAGGSGVKNLIFVEHISLGAAGTVYIKSSSTQISPRLYFPAAGTYYVGQFFESADNEALSLDIALDSAAPAAGVYSDVSYKYGVKSTATYAQN